MVGYGTIPRVNLRNWMMEMMSRIWNVILYHILGFILMTIYPNLIACKGKTEAQSYTPKSKRKRLKPKTMAMITLQRVREQLCKVTTMTTPNPAKLTKYAAKLIEFRNMGRETWTCCMEIISMQAKSPYPKGARITNFDTDSSNIGVDNRCSGCISHRIDDFEGTMTETTKSIRGFAGSRVHNVKMGTIRWRWMDDTGVTHTFRIPRSYYIPSGNVRLLSPQHWARSIDGNNRSKSAGETTTADNTILFWDHGRYKLTIPMCPKTNVATFKSAPGYKEFHSFCDQAEFDGTEDICPLIADPGIDVESSDDEHADNKINSTNSPWLSTSERNPSERRLTGSNRLKEMGTEVDVKRDNITSEFLNMHYRSGHMSFKKLQVMAKQGIIPSKFASSPIPVCSACMYGKATKRRWRDKPSKVPKEVQELQPGDKVSVDQMVSPTPGLVAQMTGILTTKRYKYATVYIDQASKMGFTYLQKTASAQETLQSKRAFEAFSANRGVVIRSYHADNGIFRANEWMEDCKRMRQPMTFAGVAAHHQNGYAERRIRTLQEMARTMLVHGNRRWREAITIQLWPYALRMANSMLNETPNMQDPERRSPEQIFTKSNIQINPKHWHTIGCPVYVLDSALQTGKPYHKWSERSRIGIYIGRSPHHARNVALVLDRDTGLVSPQFHVSYDSSFDLLKEGSIGSSWQLKAGFVSRMHNRPAAKETKVRSSSPLGKESRAQREAKRARLDDEANKEKTQKSNEERNQRLERRNAVKQRIDDLVMGSPNEDKNTTQSNELDVTN